MGGPHQLNCRNQAPQVASTTEEAALCPGGWKSQIRVLSALGSDGALLGC